MLMTRRAISIARHVIGCRLTHDTRVHNAFDDVAGNILAGPTWRREMPFPPSHYTLSAADMSDMEYPIPTLALVGRRRLTQVDHQLTGPGFSAWSRNMMSRFQMLPSMSTCAATPWKTNRRTRTATGR